MEGLVKTPMASPAANARDTRAIEPVSYSAPEGAPPRSTLGAYKPDDVQYDVQRSMRPTNRQRPGRSGCATYGFDSNYSGWQRAVWNIPPRPNSGSCGMCRSMVRPIASAAAWCLAPTPALAGFKAGDFVSAKGRLANGSPVQGALCSVVPGDFGRPPVGLMHRPILSRSCCYQAFCRNEV